MKHRLTDRNGNKHIVEEYGWDSGYATICIDNYIIKDVKMHYRAEKTWDDHMGNTPCGYYVIAPIPTGGGKVERRRVYLGF